MQISAGLPDPFAAKEWPRLQYVLKGIKRSQAGGTGRSQRLPITPQVLRKIQMAWASKPSSHDIKMLWASFTIGFFGFLWSGEFTIPSDSAFDPQSHLSPADIAVDSHNSPSLLRIHIKTDPFRQVFFIYLSRTDNSLCPVSAMLAYLPLRGLTSGPLFRFEDGHPLTRARLVDHLWAALSAANIPCDDSKYSGHSFRIGAATTAAAMGLEDSLIRTLGRWESSAYHRYIRTPRDRLAQVSRTLSWAS